jgi:hypothetical protein
METRGMKWTGHGARMGAKEEEEKKKNAYRV